MAIYMRLGSSCLHGSWLVLRCRVLQEQNLEYTHPAPSSPRPHHQCHPQGLSGAMMPAALAQAAQVTVLRPPTQQEEPRGPILMVKEEKHHPALSTPWPAGNLLKKRATHPGKGESDHSRGEGERAKGSSYPASCFPQGPREGQGPAHGISPGLGHDGFKETSPSRTPAPARTSLLKHGPAVRAPSPVGVVSFYSKLPQYVLSSLKDTV